MRDVRWTASFSSGGSDRAPLDLAEAMGRLRAGDARAIRTLLSRFDEVTTLRDAGMKAGDARDFVKGLDGLIDRTRGQPMQREVRKIVDGSLVVELEDSSGGNPGPSLTEAEYLEQIRVEMLLVDARPGSWASQVLLDGGVPQRDIDPGELAPYFGVDPARCVFLLGEGRAWTEGRWVAPEGAAGEGKGSDGEGGAPVGGEAG